MNGCKRGVGRLAAASVRTARVVVVVWGRGRAPLGRQSLFVFFHVIVAAGKYVPAGVPPAMGV